MVSVESNTTADDAVLKHPQYLGNGLSPFRVNPLPGEDMKNTTMEEYEFICPDCGQSIEVNGPMREATLEHGCPVCSSPVAPEHFAPVQ